MEYEMINDWKETFAIIEKERVVLSELDIEKINLWYKYTGWKFIKTDEVKAREKEMQLQKAKQEKLKLINDIASLSDQLNLLAGCIEVLAEGNDDPRLEYARGKFNEIKNILT